MSEDAAGHSDSARPSRAQLEYLARGLGQPGGKLPLFDRQGRPVNHQTIRACIANGWAEPWYANPIKPDWLVCRLTEAGRRLAERGAGMPDRQGTG